MNNNRPHKWYRIEMTATGQVYLREVPDHPKGAPWTRKQPSDKTVGCYTCSCCKRYL